MDYECPWCTKPFATLDLVMDHVGLCERYTREDAQQDDYLMLCYQETELDSDNGDSVSE